MKELLSKENNIDFLLKDFSFSLLLYVEFEKLSNKTFMPDKKKNNLIYIKAKYLLKKSRYKILARKIKSVLTKYKNGHINLYLFFDNIIKGTNEKRLTDLEQYLLLIKQIERELGTTILLSTPQKVDLNYGGDKGFVCVLAENLNDCFTTSGNLSANISFLVKSSSNLFVKVIYEIRKSETFDYHLDYQDEHFMRFTLIKSIS